MNDKVVLITGAAHGLGKALVEEFLASDWRVIATDIDLQEMTSLKGNKKAWGKDPSHK